MKIHYSPAEVSELMRDQSSMVKAFEDRRQALYTLVEKKASRGCRYSEELLIELSRIDTEIPLVGR